MKLEAGEKVLAVLALLVALVLCPSLALFAVSVGTHGPHTLEAPWRAWPYLFASPHVRALWLVLSALALAGSGYLIYLNRQDGSMGEASSRPDARNTSYGSARWRKGVDLLNGLARWTANAKGNPAGLVAGAEPGGRTVSHAYVVSQDGHNLIVGAPGAGKSTKVIEPTLLTIAKSGESALVLDPKGELLEASGSIFESFGYSVHRFDLRDPSYSIRWNALKLVSDALSTNDVRTATQVARQLAQILASQGMGSGGDNQFWQTSAVNLITALALAVSSKAPPTTRNLSSVYRTLIETKDLDAFFAAFPPTHPAAMAYGPVKMSQAETRQSQLAVTAAALALFGDPGVAWITAASEFDPKSLGQERTALFIVVPDETAAYHPIAALLVNDILRSLAQVAAQSPGNRLPSPCHLVLDEFPVLPALPDWDKVMAVSRGRGIRINLVVQALSQLEGVYGPSVAATIRNTCNTWVYLSSNDDQTAKAISDKTGQSTIQTTSRSQSHPGQMGQAGGINDTTGFAARPLLTTDEVLRWPRGEALVLQAGQLPARLPLRFFTEWPKPAYMPLKFQTRVIDFPATWTPGEVAEAEEPYFEMQ